MSSLTWNTTIPIGFRFNPSEEELIRVFLWRRVMGLELPWNGIAEKELYGDNAAPWEVFDDASVYRHTKKVGNTTKISIYAFTTLKYLDSKSKKIARRAGCGTWSGQTGPTTIKDSQTGELIGHMRMLSFQHNNPEAPPSLDSTHWNMHEYSLSKNMVRFSGRANAGNLVLCRITKVTKCIKKKKDSAAHHSTQPLPEVFCPYFLGNGGGFVDISVPAANKRPATEEEYSGQEYCKKQKIGEDFPGAAADDFGVGDESFDDNIDLESLGIDYNLFEQLRQPEDD